MSFLLFISSDPDSISRAVIGFVGVADRKCWHVISGLGHFSGDPVHAHCSPRVTRVRCRVSVNETLRLIEWRLVFSNGNITDQWLGVNLISFYLNNLSSATDKKVFTAIDIIPCSHGFVASRRRYNSQMNDDDIGLRRSPFLALSRRYSMAWR